MNLVKLFEMQKELDDYIVEAKGLQGEDLLPRKILALQVELGECANEWRGFKFWSENQTPRTSKKKPCDWCGGSGVDENGRTCTVCDEEATYNPLLEEYIDCLHFILSIGNQIGVPTDHPYSTYDIIGEEETLTDIFITCFNNISAYMTDGYAISDPYHFMELIRDFGSLGRLLGFTWDQIESVYTAKWEINKQRQANGY